MNCDYAVMLAKMNNLDCSPESGPILRALLDIVSDFYRYVKLPLLVECSMASVYFLSGSVGEQSPADPFRQSDQG